jgi:hypothetical protein
LGKPEGMRHCEDPDVGGKIAIKVKLEKKNSVIWNALIFVRTIGGFL